MKFEEAKSIAWRVLEEILGITITAAFTGTPSASTVLYGDGTWGPSANGALFGRCDFRLTLTSGTPVTTSDVTAATTIYATSVGGKAVGLYDGSSAWNVRTSAEMSIAVPATTDTMYDVFCYDSSGTPTLELTAWTNDTTRATALTTQDGVLVKTGATTRRYLGSFRTTGVSGQTEDSLTKRHLWNYYHRVARPMRRLESTDTWAYTTATLRQANGAAANQLDVVIGVSEDAVEAEVLAFASNTSSQQLTVGIGLDSTSALATGCLAPSSRTPASGQVPVTASWKGFTGTGRHYLVWLEQSPAAGTTNWQGDAGTPTVSQSGIHGTVFA